MVDAARRALAVGDLSAAARICANVLACAPETGRACALLPETALQRDRPDAAIVCADRAVALSPGDPIAHILRAKCLFFSGEVAPALHAAETASKIVRSEPAALDALGAIFGLFEITCGPQSCSDARSPPVRMFRSIFSIWPPPNG